MKTPSSGPRRLLRGLTVAVAATVAGTVFVALLAVLAVAAAFLGGPALVELGLTLSGR